MIERPDSGDDALVGKTYAHLLGKAFNDFRSGDSNWFEREHHFALGKFGGDMMVRIYK